MAKARNRAADATLTLPGITRPVGRPRKPDALSNSERQKAFRRRHVMAETGETMNSTIRRLAVQFDLPVSFVTRELIRFALCNRNWAQTGFPVTSNGNSI